MNRTFTMFVAALGLTMGCGPDTDTKRAPVGRTLTISVDGGAALTLDLPLVTYFPDSDAYTMGGFTADVAAARVDVNGAGGTCIEGETPPWITFTDHSVSPMAIWQSSNPPSNCTIEVEEATGSGGVIIGTFEAVLQPDNATNMPIEVSGSFAFDIDDSSPE